MDRGKDTIQELNQKIICWINRLTDQNVRWTDIQLRWTDMQLRCNSDAIQMKFRYNSDAI